MMTIDEAIAHAEWAANNCEGECSEEHKQLAEWLKELRQWQKLVEKIDLRPESLMKPLQPNVNDLERENDRLKAENKKLRSERDHWHVEQVHAYGNWEDTHKYAAKLKAENDRLRELVQEMYGFVKDVCELRPDVLMANNVPDWQVTDCRTPSERYAEKLRELGIEVPHD